MSFWRIATDSVVFLDHTVLVCAVIEGGEPNEPAFNECYNLVQRCGLGKPLGVITPRVVAQVWKRLAFLGMVGEKVKMEHAFRRGIVRSRPDTGLELDVRARIEGLVNSELLLLNPEAADFTAAYDLVENTILDIGMAVDIAAAKRTFENKLVLATLSRDYDTAEARGFTLVKPKTPVLESG
jgi:hypothetical protein